MARHAGHLRRIAEQRIQQYRQGRIGHVVDELRVVDGLTGIELVLVRQADHELIHERHAQARYLLEVIAVQAGVAIIAVGRQAQARRGPCADNRIRPGRQAGDWQFEGNGRDVLVRYRVRFGVARTDRIGIDQVEYFAKIDDEAVLALTNENPARRTASRDADVVDEVAGVAGVIGNGILADVIGGLPEGRATVARIFGPLDAVLSAAHHFDRIALNDVQIGATGRHRPDVDQWHRDTLAARVDGQVLDRVREMKAKRQRGLGAAGVVDVNVVDRMRVEVEVVRTAVGVLQRNVVCDECDIIRAARLVAAEHVEVGAVDARHAGDGGCLTMAGCHRKRRQTGACEHDRGA